MSKKLKILLIVLISSTIGTAIYSNKINKKSKLITSITTPVIETTKKIEITTPIFYPELKSGKLSLKMEDIVLNSDLKTKEDILKDIVQQLFLKLKEKEILKKENLIYEVYIKNRVVYLDLDSEVLSSAKNPQEELFLIYSFVNSLLTPGGADTVVLLTNGTFIEKVKFININKSYRLNNSI